MPAPEVAALVEASEDADLPGRLKTELHASVVELNTAVCVGAAEAFDAVAALRHAAADGAHARGLVVAAAGAHPLVRPEDLEIVPEPRYLRFVEYAGPSARRQAVNGLHVHVGMPSGDEALRVLDGVVPWLPLVLALSANSPYWRGEEAGLMSVRAETLALLPRRGAPPSLSSYAEWERLIERFVSTGLVSDYTAFWWDARLHPSFGTLEIRMADQPTAIATTQALVALLQALCAYALDEPPPARDEAARIVYDQNRWAALRFGPRATMIHPLDGTAVDAPELAAELVERLRPAARELGTEAVLASLPLARCEADTQLAVGRRDGLHAVCADLVARSAPGAPA
jgi:carboxylate-amine ligase